MDRTQRFQDQWFGLVLLGASVLAVYHGVRIVLRREIDNPLVTLRGGKALAVGLAAVALGVAGAALAVRTGLGGGP